MATRGIRSVALAAAAVGTSLFVNPSSISAWDGVSVGFVVRSFPSHATFSGYSIDGVVPGDVIQLDIVATVFENMTSAQFGFYSASGSFQSVSRFESPSGFGEFVAHVDPAFQGDGWSDGTRRDLDNDGDSDVGSNDDLHREGFFNAVAAAGQMLPGSQFKLGTAEFTVSIASGAAETWLRFMPRQSPDAAVWSLNGITRSGPAWQNGDVAVNSIPEPTTAALLAAMTAAFVSVRRRRD